MQVTDEMRRAVYADDCARLGHQIDASNALRSAPLGNPNDPHGIPKMEVRGPDGQHPHLVCRHCGMSWIVLEDPGVDHDDALVKVVDRLKDDDPMRGDDPRKRPKGPGNNQPLDRGHGH